MLKKSLIPAFYVGCMVHLILNLFWGSQGVYALRDLRSERVSLETNMQILTTENRDVQIHLDQLKNDRISISLLARKLGYVREGEKIIYTEWGGATNNFSYGLPVIRTGTVTENKDRSRFFRGLSAVAALSVFFLMLILEWGEKGIRRTQR